MIEKLKELIESHIPYNEEETRDKESFLQFINNFPPETIASRDNLIGHLTASAFIVNKEKTKVLFAYHKIYNSWAWLGGHADGDLNLLNVAQKEAKEESNIDNLKIIDAIDVSINGVNAHNKKGKFIPDHLHFNVTFIFEADENQEIEFCKEESSGIEWILISELPKNVETDADYIKKVYSRILKKIGATSPF